MSSPSRLRAVLVALVILLNGALTPTVTVAGMPSFVPPATWANLCTTISEAGSPLTPGTTCRYLRLDGVWRQYLVYLPINPLFPIDRAWPLVIMFHGNTSRGEGMRKISGWKELAEEKGLVVAFPTAWRYEQADGSQGTRWNTWALPGEIVPDVRLDGYPRTAPYPARDVEFVRRIVDDLGGSLTLDRHHLHLSGFSNGGKFVQRVAREMSDVFASATCAGWCDTPREGVAAGLPGGPTRAGDRNVPMLYGLGTLDESVLAWLGTHPRRDLGSLSLVWTATAPIVRPLIADILERWELDPERTVVSVVGSRTTVRWRTPVPGNVDGNTFRLILLAGVRHRYPRPGNNPGSIDFTRISWRFFTTNPMP